MVKTHIVSNSLLRSYSKISVALIGCGGIGSQLITALARLNYILGEIGHPGLNVIAYDGDSVSKSNCGRQLFSPADIGRNKAVVMVNRVNMFFGLNWQACPQDFNKNNTQKAEIVITAVDSANARIEIAKCFKKFNNLYWLDCGNTASSGQVILGTLFNILQPKGKEFMSALPTVLDLYPNIKDEDTKEKQGPSCSVREAITRQEPVINQWVATTAFQLLWEMFRRGKLKNHGAFINSKTLTVKPLPVDPDVWKRFGATIKYKKAA